MVGEELTNIFTQILLGDGRDLRRQDDSEAVGSDLPAHDLFGVRVEPAPGGQHLGTPALATGTVASFGDDGAGAITEEAGGNKIGNRIVLTLNGQRAQFDR